MKTPRTDAVYPPHIIDREFAEQGRSFGWGTLHDMRECSRKLETELSVMTALADRLAEACENLQDGNPAAQHVIKNALAAYEKHKQNTP